MSTHVQQERVLEMMAFEDSRKQINEMDSNTNACVKKYKYKCDNVHLASMRESFVNQRS